MDVNRVVSADNAPRGAELQRVKRVLSGWESTALSCGLANDDSVSGVQDAFHGGVLVYAQVVYDKRVRYTCTGLNMPGTVKVDVLVI